MKKIISISLVVALLSLLAGCAMGIGDVPAPTQKPEVITPTPELPTENPDAIYILGLFYRTKGGTAMLLSKDIGQLVLHNDLNEFKDIMDFAIIKAETDVIMESYPAQTTIKNWGVTNTATIIADYKDMVDEMCKMGHIPATPFGDEETKEPPVVELSNSIYDRYAQIMDNSAEQNILFSPLSLNFALGMLSNAANEEALLMFEEYFGMTVPEYNEFVKEYMENAQPERGNTSVEIANGIWVRNDLTLRENFQSNLTDMYCASVKSGEFGPELAKEINDWCAKKTHDMIPFILDTLPADAVSVLANALYFNAEWMEPYQESQINDEEFKTLDGTTKTVTALHSTDEMPYYENEHAVAFSKYYSDGRYSFVGILPKEEGDFSIKSLDLESLMANKSETYKIVSMIPKFEFENSHEMLPLLNHAELPVGEYQYPNMVNEMPLAVDRIIQKTAIKLTESGTTAAAVTAIVMKNQAFIEMPEQEQKEVILNRPFAFMIYDNDMNLPLFIGKVTTL